MIDTRPRELRECIHHSRARLLELGSEARMNFPGIAKGNWGWRLKDGTLSGKLAQRLCVLNVECERLMSPNHLPAAQVQKAIIRPEIARRAYELFERRGRQSGQSDQDWFEAEREIKLEATR